MHRDLLSPAFWSTTLPAPTVELLVKATLLLIAALTLSLALRSAAAGARHLVWTVTICALLLMPALSAASPWRFPVLPAALAATNAGGRDAVAAEKNGAPGAPRARAGDRPAGGAPEDAGLAVIPAVPSGSIAGATPVPGDADAVQRAAHTAPSLSVLILLAWGIVAAGLLGRLVVGWALVRRIARSGEELTAAGWTAPLWESADRLDLADVPRLIRSDRAAMPFMCGIRRPIIVLPPEADGWSDERRRAVLFHELAHVRRRDLMSHTLGRIACALYWPHPLVWSAARRLRAESERACDDLVLATGARASDYAAHLLQIVTAARHSRAPAVALPMAQRREFEGRMLAILDPRERRAPAPLRAAAAASGMLVIAAVLAAAAPVMPAPDGTMAIAGGSSAIDSPAPEQSGLPRSTESSFIASDSVRERHRLPPADGAPPIDERAHSSAPAAPRPGLIERFVAEIADLATEVTMESLREIGLPVPPPDSKDSPQGDDPQRVRETALLVATLQSHEEARVRRVAAWGLQRRLLPEATSALASALRDDRSAGVREMAAWALEAHPRAEAMRALASAATTDADPGVRATAVWALGHRRVDRHADAIAQALGDPNADVRLVAAWALGRIKPPTAPQELVMLLDDARPDVRKAAAWALSEIRDPEAVPALLRALDRESLREVREPVVRALVRTDRSPELLERLVGSPHGDVQERAIRAIGAGRSGDDWPWPWPWPRPRPMP